jgi:hypothetical protein
MRVSPRILQFRVSPDYSLRFMVYVRDRPRSRPGERRKVEHHFLELPVKFLLPFLRKGGSAGEREGVTNPTI